MTDEQRDRRLRKTYGITLADRTKMEEEQDGKCAICRQPPAPGGRALHVDHDHKYSKIKIMTIRVSGGGWLASTTYKSHPFQATGSQKSKAAQTVRHLLKTASVRGLLCWRCNAGLRAYGDRPELFAAAEEYLRRFNEGNT